MLIFIFFVSFSVRVITAIVYLNFDKHYLSKGHQSFLPLGEKFSDVAGVVGDRDGYNAIAYNILKYGRIGDVPYRSPSMPPPLYPIFLALCYFVFGHNIFAFFIPHIILDSFNTLLVFFLAQRLFNHRGVSITAGLFYAFNPHFIISSLQIYSETLYFFLVLSLFLFCHRFLLKPQTRYAVSIGILMALAALCRSVFWAFAPFIFFWLMRVICREKKRGLSFLLIIFLSFMLVYGIWILRNRKVFPRILLSEASRAAWWQTNWPSDIDEALTARSKYKEDWSAFLDWIKKNPKEYSILCRERLKTLLFSPYVEGVSLRNKIVSSVVFFTVFGLGYFGIFKSISEKNKMAILISLFIISKITLHTLLGLEGELRYRLPIELFMMLFAAYGLSVVYKKLKTI